MRKFWILLFLLNLFLLVSGCHRATQTSTPNRMTPIIMVGGYGSNRGTFSDFVAEFKKDHYAVNDVTAIISSNGKVSYLGDLRQHAGRPVIRVVFKNNQATVKQDAQWLAVLLVQLKSSYHFKHYAALGHSMGSVALVYQALLLNHAQQPKLSRMVTIAGHFNGWIKEGIPGVDPGTNHLKRNGQPVIQSSEYRQMAQQSQRITKVPVLNIVGDVQNGSTSDTRVTTVSAHSLRYLLRDDRQLKTLDVLGKQAQHSQLRHNSQVLKATEKWLMRGSSDE